MCHAPTCSCEDFAAEEHGSDVCECGHLLQSHVQVNDETEVQEG